MCPAEGTTSAVAAEFGRPYPTGLPQWHTNRPSPDERRRGLGRQPTTRTQGSADRRQRPPRFSGTRSGPRSGAFDSPARLGGTDSQQITQQLRRVAVAGIGRETTALGLGDRGDHGRTQSPPVALGFDESAQQVDIGQFRPSPRRRMRCRCSRMCVHPADPTSRIEHMFDKSACWVMRVRTGRETHRQNSPPKPS